MESLLLFVKFLHMVLEIFLRGYEVGHTTIAEIMSHGGWVARPGSDHVAPKQPKSVTPKGPLKKAPEVSKQKSKPISNSKNDPGDEQKHNHLTAKKLAPRTKASPSPSKEEKKSNSKAKAFKKRPIPSGKVCASDRCDRIAAVSKPNGGFLCCGSCPKHAKNCITGLVGNTYEHFTRLEMIEFAGSDKMKVKLLPFQRNVWLSATFVRGDLSEVDWTKFKNAMPMYGIIDEQKGFKFDKFPIYLKDSEYDDEKKKARLGLLNKRQAVVPKIATILAVLASLTGGVDGMIVKVIKSDLPTFEIKEVASLAKWRLSPSKASLLEGRSSETITDGSMVIPFPNILEIVLDCSSNLTNYTFDKKTVTVTDMCGQEPQSYAIEYSSSYACFEEPKTIEEFQEMLADPGCSCALVSDKSLLSTIKRKFGRIKITRPFKISTSSIVGTLTSWVSKEDGAFVGRERGMGIVQVDGAHMGTFFCVDKHAFTAWHVVDTYRLWGGSTPTVELCAGTCITVTNMRKIGLDVASIDVPLGWCVTPRLKSPKPTAVAYTRNKERAVMDVIVSTSGSETSLTVSAGVWTKGMSGGPLFVDEKPVGVITAMRGFFFTQQLRAYGLDGNPFSQDFNDEL